MAGTGTSSGCHRRTQLLLKKYKPKYIVIVIKLIPLTTINNILKIRSRSNTEPKSVHNIDNNTPRQNLSYILILQIKLNSEVEIPETITIAANA